MDQGYSGEIVLNPIYEKIVVAAKHRTLIDGDFKLIYMPTKQGVRYELFDRRNDPNNFHDLASTDVVHLAELRQSLIKFIKQIEGPHSLLIDDFVVPQ